MFFICLFYIELTKFEFVLERLILKVKYCFNKNDSTLKTRNSNFELKMEKNIPFKKKKL